jgi:ankyrin repeat protein
LASLQNRFGFAFKFYQEGNTPLMIAVKNEHTEAVKWLLQSGRDIGFEAKSQVSVDMFLKKSLRVLNMGDIRLLCLSRWV